MHLETIIVAAITGVLASLVTAFVNKSTADKKNAIENITQERKKWRDDIRTATLDVRRLSQNKEMLEKIPKEKVSKMRIISLEEACSYFEIRLNPNDSADNDILRSLKNKNIDLFEKQVAALLKYDWDRAKKEVSAKSHLFVLGRCLALLGFVVSSKEWLLNEGYFQLNLSAMQTVSLTDSILKLIGIVFAVILVEKGICKLFDYFVKKGYMNTIRQFCKICPCCIGMAVALIFFVTVVAMHVGSICFAVIFVVIKILEELCSKPNRIFIE